MNIDKIEEIRNSLSNIWEFNNKNKTSNLQWEIAYIRRLIREEELGNGSIISNLPMRPKMKDYDKDGYALHKHLSDLIDWAEKVEIQLQKEPQDTWFNVNDESVKIPYTKVAIWDGGNTFWAYLQEIKETSSGRELEWKVMTPEGYGECKPLFWKKIMPPKGYQL